jgi:hypothetical protein
VNILQTAVLLIGQTEVNPSGESASFELAIWRWVVIIGVGAFVAIFAIKRIADIAAKRKTEMIIEEVVGKGESVNAAGWIDDDDEEDDEQQD